MDNVELETQEEKIKTTTTITFLMSVPIKRALIRVAEKNGMLISDVLRMTILRHVAEDFPEFTAIAQEETENFIAQKPETKG